jgi:hypothetical protein
MDHVAWARTSDAGSEYPGRVQSWNHDSADTHHQHDYLTTLSADGKSRAQVCKARRR